MADSYSVPPVCSLRCFIYIIYTLIVDYYESALKMKNLGLGEQNHFDESHKVRKEQRQDGEGGTVDGLCRQDTFPSFSKP